MINVLIVVDHLSYEDNMHGVGRFMLNVLPYIDKNRFNIILCVLRKKDALSDLFISQNIKIRYLGKKKFDPSTFFSIFKIIKDEKIDLLHLHQYGSINFGRIAALIAGVPVIIHLHDTDPYYTLYLKIFDYILAPFTDKVISVSEGAKKSTVDKKNICADKVIVMHNAIPQEKYDVLTPGEKEIEKKSLGINPDYKIIGTVTRLRAEKGNEYFLKAASEVLKIFPKTKYIIVGDGPIREELQQLCKKLNIEEKVIFYGFSNNVQKMYSLFDITIIASVAEAFPYALLEAIAMGKAVVSTDTDGPKEILVNGETGLLVPVKDSKMLAKKIIYLLENEEEIKRLGLNAKKESEKYDINIYVKKLEEEYQNLLSEGSKY